MRKRGFSLIELLIGSSLVIILITGTAELIVASLAAKKKADFYFSAVRLASSRLEHLKSQPFESPGLKKGQYKESFREGTTGEVFCTEWTIEDIGEGLKKISLVMNSSSSSRREMALSVLLCRELEF